MRSRTFNPQIKPDELKNPPAKVKSNKYITPRYLDRSMARLCFFEDLPPSIKEIPESELQEILDKWEKREVFAEPQLYALRNYYKFKAQFDYT